MKCKANKYCRISKASLSFSYENSGTEWTNL